MRIFSGPRVIAFCVCVTFAHSSAGIQKDTTPIDVVTTASNELHRTPGEISKRKCWEYGQLIYKQVRLPSLGLTSSGNRYKTETQCHVKPTFVHGGEDAGPKEFPHMALLGYGGKDNVEWGCGGSLISEKYILTAAHCLAGQKLGNVTWVRLGDLDISLTTDDASPQELQVKTRIRHPDFKRPSKYNDIALIELDRPVTFTDYVRPACLQVTYEVHKRFLVSGWGKVDDDDLQLSSILQKANVEEFTHDECSVKYESLIGFNSLKQGIIDGSQICAGGKMNNTDTCPGDSGGPLQIKNPLVNCTYNIVGVTSIGQQRCGVKGTPGIYTRVSNYIKWIEDIVWP